MESQTSKFSNVRWMIRRDISDVLDIESRSFGHALDEQQILEMLRVRNQIGMCIEHEGRVVGHMIYRLERSQITLMTLAVHPSFRRSSAGKRMVDKLKTKLNENRRRMLNIIVRETNLGGLKFLAKQGFRAIEVQRGHFEDEGHDGYLMKYEIEQTFSAEPEGAMPKNRVLKYLQP